jgi:hypothetical protein
MSTTIPIQDLDISVSPPDNRTIHAVVTLLWPYSSSTRQCALLLSERDFRLRARGGQIRVKFSGLAARAVADGRPGIGDEVVLELGSSEWVKDEGGAPIRVPGKSVGELHFERGVRMTVKKNGAEDVQVSVAEDAVEEVEEEEAPQVQATPRQKSNFRASFGGSPGSAAIYSSPAYMRKAAKYSYLDGVSRLFEDEWDNQDLPRKKARTSLSNVTSWKMVDRTPSPERPPSAVAAQEDEEMGEADSVKDTSGDMDGQPAAESATSQAIATPPPNEQEPTVIQSVEVVDAPTSPPGSHADPVPEGQDAITLPATSMTSTLPRLQLPTASPSSQQSQAATAAAAIIDPVTPRLVPLSSTKLPSTTPQISPLATKNTFGGQVDAVLEGVHGSSQAAEIPESHAEKEATASKSPQPTADDSLEQNQPAVTQPKSVAEVIAATTPAGPVTLEESEGEDAPGSSDELAEEDEFSDDEADEVLSAHEKDDEMMYEEDAEDVFDADGLEGGEPSDDETIKNPHMHRSPLDDQRMEEPSDDETIKDPDMHQSPLEDQSIDDATAEQDSDIEDPIPDQSHIQSSVAAQPTASTPERDVYKQPSFTSASTLLRGENTEITNTEPAIPVEQPKLTTPFKKPTFNVGGVLPSTEVATPVPRTTETPKRTPQSVRDKIPKRTFSSLFGIRGTPSPEKEDPIVFGKESNDEEKHERQVDQAVDEPSASEDREINVSPSRRDRYMGLDGQSEPEETRSLENAPAVNSPIVQASSPSNHDAPEVNDVPSAAASERSEQPEDDELPDAAPRDEIVAESQPAELINLDSSSDEEAEEPKAEETTTKQAPESHELSPAVLASTVDEHIGAESNDASMQEDLIDIAASEPVLVDAEQAISEHDVSEQQRPPNEEHQDEEVAAPNDDDRDVTTIQPLEAPESPHAILDTVIPDSMEQSTVSPRVTLSPELEVQDRISLEPEQTVQEAPEQSQPFDSVADIVELGHEPGQQVTSLEIPDSVQPSPAQQEEELTSASTTPKNVSNTYGNSQPDSVEVDDVDMLDAQQQEPELRRSSLKSQVVQDSVNVQDQEPEASFASFESQVIQDSFDSQKREPEPEPSLASFESQVAQDSFSAQQQEPEASLASFEAQTEQDRIRRWEEALRGCGVFEPQAQGSARQQEPDAPLVSQEEQYMNAARELGVGSFKSQVQESAPQQELDAPLVSQEEPARIDARKPALGSFESQVQENELQQELDAPLLSQQEPARVDAREQILGGTELFESQAQGSARRSSRPTSRDSQAEQDMIRARELALGSFESRVLQETARKQELDSLAMSQREKDLISARETVFRGIEFEDAQRRESARQHKAASVNKRSSRPASRDTVEDFSPVQLGSYSQRISETFSPTRAPRQQDSQNVNTPSRATKRRTVAELGSSPSSFGEFSPVKIGQSTNRQVLTPRATFPEEEEQEDDSMADETLIEQQLASEIVEEPIGSDTRPLAYQSSAEGMPQYRPLDGTSEQDKQANRHYAESTKESPAYPTLPISPSATQSQSQAQQIEQERSDMPPPEQPAPPKTPGRKSLRSRLSNVPDVISAWFSPKRSSVAAQEAENPTEPETPAATTAETVQNDFARKKQVAGIATAHTYFTKLASLEKRVNEQNGAVDVLAIVADSTKEPGRAKGGPRDYYTIFKIMDPSIPIPSPVRVEVFRPWKAVLPAADVGDVILLRGFVVKSRKRQPYLLSTDSSAWCVWRFAEHTDDVGNVVVREADRSVRARRMSHIDVREEVKGPPVEYGFAEKEEARKLRDWWIGNHDDSQGGASEEAVGNTHSEDMDAIES